MKTIKIKYIGFWDGFKPETNILTSTMMKFYNVVESENPDYIICSVFEDKENYEYCRYPQIRIMYSGENYIPDFNMVDYAISSYPITFQDRHFRYPMCFDNYNNRFPLLLNKDRNYSKDILNQKIYFANFIASHESEGGLRGDFFKELSEYKRIESFGSYLNNQESGFKVNINTKTEQQKKCKFTLCFESTKHEGFITEKITDAFFADTIPIYYGSSDIKEIFNEKAFINCSDYYSFEKAIERIIEIDNDDEEYLKMLRQPVFKNIDFAKNINKELERFVCNIFDQSIKDAYRRSRVYAPLWHEKYLLKLKGVNNPTIDKKKNLHLLKKSATRLKCKQIIKSIKLKFLGKDYN